MDVHHVDALETNVSLCLPHTFADDHEMLRHGMVLYDALHAWCRSCRAETHGWPPQATVPDNPPPGGPR